MSQRCLIPDYQRERTYYLNSYQWNNNNNIEADLFGWHVKGLFPRAFNKSHNMSNY